MLSFVKLQCCASSIKALLHSLFCPYIIIQLIIFAGLCIKGHARFLNGHLFTLFWAILAQFVQGL